MIRLNTCTSATLEAKPLMPSDTDTAVVVALLTKEDRAESLSPAAEAAGLGGRYWGVPVASEPTTEEAPDTTRSGRSPAVPGNFPWAEAEAKAEAEAEAEGEKVIVVVKTAALPPRASEREGQIRPVVELLDSDTPSRGTGASPCRASRRVALAAWESEGSKVQFAPAKYPPPMVEQGGPGRGSTREWAQMVVE